SAAWWLIEDLGHLSCRLRKTLPGHQPAQDQLTAAPSVKPIAESETRTTASSRDDLDTATSIGNQITVMRDHLPKADHDPDRPHVALFCAQTWAVGFDPAATA